MAVNASIAKGSYLSPGADGADDSEWVFTKIVYQWGIERETAGLVQPYTAMKGVQKASLFMPWIGDLRPSEVDPEIVRGALVELSRCGGRDGKGLSSSTLRAAHLAATQAIDWAIGRGVGRQNPFRLVPRPKARHRSSQFLTMGQASDLGALAARDVRNELFLGNVSRSSFALAACIAVATGLRRGEIFALEWSDCDLALCRLSVSKAVKADGRMGAPKSVSGIRSVAIGKCLASLLLEVLEWQRKHLPERAWHERQHVICDEFGARASMNSFEHWWRSWADRNGWVGLRFHELRHTHATLLIARGVDVKTVQMRLGHSSAEITMSCYAHAIPLSDGAAAASLDAALFR